MRHPWALCIYALAMGMLEAIVVVYLRRIYYPGGFTFPLVPMEPAMLRAEIVREAMTLIMLWAVAWLAAATAWTRLLAFLTAFGVWDLSYYLGLKLFLDWPGSWLTPDILFLIPKVWIGPVLAPALVAMAWTIGGLLLRHSDHRRIGLGWRTWAVGTLAAGLILASFLLPGASFDPARPMDPRQAASAFSWPLYLAGLLLGSAALGRLILIHRGVSRRSSGHSGPPRSARG